MLDSGFGAGLLHVHDPGCPCRAQARCPRMTHAPGAHDPVIGPDEWRQYLDRRHRIATNPPRARSPRYPVTGLVACGHCRAAMRVSDLAAPSQPVMRCKRHATARDCPGATVNHLIADIRSRLEETLGRLDAAAHAQEALDLRRSSAASATAAAEQTLRAIERRLARLARVREADDLLPDETRTRAEKVLRQERDVARETLANAQERERALPAAVPPFPLSRFRTPGTRSRPPS